MEKETETNKNLDERKEKVKAWLKNPNNLILLAILIFAFFIRFHYFSLTQNQPLWWDEGEYGLKAKSLAFGTPTTGWYAAREIVVPLIFSFVLRFGGTEVSWRLLQLLVSFLTVLLVYLLASRMFNRKIALIASAILAVNAVHLFFTCRILVYLWAPLFFVLSFYLFYMGYVLRKGRRYLYSFPIAAALGISVYSSLAFGVIAIFLFLIITERHHFLKKREIWIMLLLGIISLLPLLVYWTIAYGSPVARWAALQSTTPVFDFSFFFSYFSIFPHLFGWVFTIAVIAGTAYIFSILFVSFDLVLKNQHNILKSYLLIVLWALAVLGFYTYVGLGWHVIYDAFVISSFPALAIIGALGISLVYNINFNKKILAFIIIAIVLLGGYYQLKYADGMIKTKLNSFDSVKYAGEWIKANSNSSDSVVSSSLPQMTYYSERTTYAYGPVNVTQEEFEKLLNSKKPKYITDSLWENVAPWVHQYAYLHNDTLIPVQAYFLDAQKTQPSLIVYIVKY